MNDYRKLMREYVSSPYDGSALHYGKWGALNPEQRAMINRLLDEMDRADEYIKNKEFLLLSQGKELKELYSENDELQQENKQLKDNWNELKEFIKDKYVYYEKETLDFFYGYKVGILGIRDKMQELEKGEGNE